MVAMLVACVAALMVVPAARATPQRYRITVTPRSPTLRQSVTITLAAPKLKLGKHYEASFGVDDVGGRVCLGGGAGAMGRTSKGTFRLKLTVRPANVPGGRATTWCPGPATVRIIRRGPGGLYTGTLATRKLTFRIGTGETMPPADPGVPVKITLLGGSTLTATAAGRPDRSAQLTGVLRGTIPGGARPNTDVPVEQISGSLAPQAVFPPDPLCPDTPPPGTFDVVPASSQMLLKADGDATLNLTLNGAASQLFGCGPSGSLSGTTMLPLSGQVARPGGLTVPLPVAGNVGAISLPNGSQGGLAANLLLNVDLSGAG